MSRELRGTRRGRESKLMAMHPYQAAMRTFHVPQYMHQTAKMSVLYRNMGLGFDHPYARLHKSMVASRRFTLDPFTEVRLQAEADVKEWERELARAEAELIDAIRPRRLAERNQPEITEEKLVDELAKVVTNPDIAMLIVDRAGFDRGLIPRFCTPLTFWHEIVRAASNGANQGHVQALVEVAANLHPGNRIFACYRSLP